MLLRGRSVALYSMPYRTGRLVTWMTGIGHSVRVLVLSAGTARTHRLRLLPALVSAAILQSVFAFFALPCCPSMNHK